jgi:hypothetical protein
MADPTAIFTTAELRAFDKGQLGNVVTYSDAALTSIEAEVREQFGEICGVQFIPKTETDYYTDASGTQTIYLPFAKLISVSAAVIYDYDGVAVSETLDATDLTYLAVRPDGCVTRRAGGLWSPCGERNVKLTFKHGYTAVPYAIKRAAMTIATYKLIPSDIYDRTTAMSDGTMTFSLATAGRRMGNGAVQWFGIPAVDTVLEQYDQTLPGIA